MRLEENYPFANHKGRDMVDTNHSIDRSFEHGQVDRYLFPSMRAYKDKHVAMIKQAIDQILTKYRDTSATYVLYSKGTGLGVVISWRKDRFSGDTKNHAYIVTILKAKPVPHYLTHRDDVQIFVEVQTLLKDYVKDSHKKLVENVEKHGYQRVNLIGDDFVVHFYDDKIMDIDVETIIVE